MAGKAGNLGSALSGLRRQLFGESAVRRIQTRWVAGWQDLGGISVHRFPRGAGGRAPPCCWALQQPRKGAGARVFVGGKVTVAPISGQGPPSHPASTPTGLGGLEQPTCEWVFGTVFPWAHSHLCVRVCVSDPVCVFWGLTCLSAWVCMCAHVCVPWILFVCFLRGLCAFQLWHLCVYACLCVCPQLCVSDPSCAFRGGGGRKRTPELGHMPVRLYVSRHFPPNGPKRNPGSRLLCCFQGCSWVGEGGGGGLPLGGVGGGRQKEILKDCLPSGLQGDQPVK